MKALALRNLNLNIRKYFVNFATLRNSIVVFYSKNWPKSGFLAP